MLSPPCCNRSVFPILHFPSQLSWKMPSFIPTSNYPLLQLPFAPFPQHHLLPFTRSINFVPYSPFPITAPPAQSRSILSRRKRAPTTILFPNRPQATSKISPIHSSTSHLRHPFHSQPPLSNLHSHHLHKSITKSSAQILLSPAYQTAARPRTSRSVKVSSCSGGLEPHEAEVAGGGDVRKRRSAALRISTSHPTVSIISTTRLHHHTITSSTPSIANPSVFLHRMLLPPSRRPSTMSRAQHCPPSQSAITPPAPSPLPLWPTEFHRAQR